ncbi:MAG: hypothetical protein ACHQ50_03060 [Fimbriimonadales bacterium]
MKHLGTLVLASLIVIGCGKSETTVVGSNGEKATVSKAGDSTTITDEKGKSTTFTGNDKQMSVTTSEGTKMEAGKGVSEADLGLPFYPGSTEKPAASMTMSGAKGEKVVMGARTSKDDPAKVIAFYKDKIEGAKDFSMNSDDTKSATVGGKLKDGSDVAVTASKKGSDDTEIMVTVTHQKK